MFSQQMRARVFFHYSENGKISIFAKRGVHWTSGQLRFSLRFSKGLKIFSITTFARANIYTIYFISSQIVESIIPRSSRFVVLAFALFISQYDFDRIGTIKATARGIFVKISTANLYQYEKVNCHRTDSIDRSVIFRYRFNALRSRLFYRHRSDNSRRQNYVYRISMGIMIFA